MSDEYSLHSKFVQGEITAAEYERRIARLTEQETCGAVHLFFGQCHLDAGHEDDHYSATATASCRWLGSQS